MTIDIYRDKNKRKFLSIMEENGDHANDYLWLGIYLGLYGYLPTIRMAEASAELIEEIRFDINKVKEIAMHIKKAI